MNAGNTFVRHSKKYDTKHYQRARSVDLIRSGKEFFDLLNRLFDEAESEIHFQMYILEMDQTGRRLIESLKRAVKRNVDVHLVLDAYGSDKLEKSDIRMIEDAGIHFKWFRPVFQFGNMEFGRRMHHKIISIDENICIATGVNIADRYNSIGDRQAWLDFAIVVEGPSAREVKQRALQVWEKNFHLNKILHKFRLPKLKQAISSENALVKVSVNDWLRGRIDIYNGYLNAFSKAQKEIVVVGGYFIPGRILRRKLREATERNVKVKVILTRISDVHFAKRASEYLYRWMFKNNIEIYEWEPGMLHGKVAVVDRDWATIGSFNLNYLSTFESIELNLEVIDKSFSNGVSKMLHEIIENECVHISEESYDRGFSIKKRVLNWISYRIVRWSMRILNAFSHKPQK